MRKQAPPDLICATQLAAAADWARIYLLSGLSDDVVDELFLTPVSNESEVHRLLNDESRCLFLEAAQFAYGAVRGSNAQRPGDVTTTDATPTGDGRIGHSRGKRVD